MKNQSEISTWHHIKVSPLTTGKKKKKKKKIVSNTFFHSHGSKKSKKNSTDRLMSLQGGFLFR
jgi:hypothetical protein